MHQLPTPQLQTQAKHLAFSHLLPIPAFSSLPATDYPCSYHTFMPLLLLLGHDLTQLLS
jgi:hypothetical protein